jgi:hypothetical protein
MKDNLRVLPGEGRKPITACDECRHMRHGFDRDPAFAKCAAVGGYISSIRQIVKATGELTPCNFWQEQPKRPPGLLRRFWAWLW